MNDLKTPIMAAGLADPDKFRPAKEEGSLNKLLPRLHSLS